MRVLLLQVAAICGFTLVAGTSFQLVTGKLEFFVRSGRYPNSRVCHTVETGEPSGGARPGGPGASGPGQDPGAPGDPGEAGDPGTTEEGAGDPERAVPPAPGPDDLPETSSLGLPFSEFDEFVGHWLDQLLIVDARPRRLYEEGHIPGAISIPAYMARMEDRIAALRETEPTEIPIMVYCNEADSCEDSELTGSNLRDWGGYSNVHVFRGGFPMWLARKMPVVRGAEPGERGAGEVPSDVAEELGIEGGDR